MTISSDIMLPAFIERAKTQTLILDLREYGGIVQPTSGTISIYDSSDTAIVDGAVLTLTDDQASYQLAAALIPDTLSLSDRWRIEWVMVVDGKTETIRQEAHLCRSTLYPVISDTHIYRRHSSLRDLLPADKASWQPYLEDAWDDIQVMLLEAGKRPYLVLSPWSLKSIHLHMALARIFRDLSTFTQGKGKYTELAEYYEAQAKDDWKGLTLDYDFSEDGLLTEDEEQVSTDSVMFLNGNVRDFWTGRY